MSNSKFTDEQLIELIKSGTIANRKLGVALGVDESTVRARLKKLQRKGFDISYKGWNTSVPDGFRSKGRTIQVDALGNITQQWEKSCIDHERQYEILHETTLELIKDLPSYKLTKPKKKINYLDTMCIYPFGDPHIGMRAWMEECGENWDLKIAEETFRKMFDIIVDKSPASLVAILHFLGDTLHYDNMMGITARSGNVLDCDGRYPNMVKVTTYIIINMINSLRQKHKKVVVNIDRGNHDDIGQIWLVEMLLHLYKNNPNVEIIDTPAPIHIYEFGKVLIASHHGHTMKMKDLPITVASDHPEAWGRTKHRYGLTGHVHHDATLSLHGQEYTGMYVESLRTLAAKDAFATWGGYRSKRDTKCIVYHKELGEIERYVASIDALLLQV